MPSTVDPRALRRKLTWRIVPLAFVIYIVAWLDRHNAGVAKLQMKDLPGFSDGVFGLGFGAFYVGYLLMEIPGGLMVELWSARKWFTRILLTWGCCSMAMALVRTPWQFYLARFFLGLAEAGFFPGIIVYFTHWFPKADRGRATAGMVLATPFSMALGAPLSGVLLDQDALGLAGWQWLFVVEGVPAVLLGILVFFVVTDRPSQARWLTPEEKAWLEETLRKERLEAAAVGGMSLRQAMRWPAVWLLALGILLANTGAFALIHWMPTTVGDLLRETWSDATNREVLLWTGLIYACGLGGAFVSGQTSDRTGDRKWHCVAGMGMAGLFLVGAVLAGGSWAAMVCCLCGVGFFAYFWPAPFWVLPTLSLSASAAAVAVAFISMCANTAGLIGPPLVGLMKEVGWSDRAFLLAAAACYGMGAAVISLVRIRRQPVPTIS